MNKRTKEDYEKTTNEIIHVFFRPVVVSVTNTIDGIWIFFLVFCFSFFPFVYHSRFDTINNNTCALLRCVISAVRCPCKPSRSKKRGIFCVYWKCCHSKISISVCAVLQRGNRIDLSTFLSKPNVFFFWISIFSGVLQIESPLSTCVCIFTAARKKCKQLDSFLTKWKKQNQWIYA